MKYLHTMVRVRDLDAAIAFYCDKLGLAEVSRNENPGGRFTLVFLCAPDDLQRARDDRAPLVELTYNWTLKITTAVATSVTWPMRSTTSTPRASAWPTAG